MTEYHVELKYGSHLVLHYEGNDKAKLSGLILDACNFADTHDIANMVEIIYRKDGDLLVVVFDNDNGWDWTND